MESFQKMVKIPQQNGTISEKGQKSSTKWYHFRIGLKILDKNGTISEKGQNSSTKIVPFQKGVKNRQQKWYHFSQKMIKIPQQKWYHFRKGSKILNKNGTMNKERRQDFYIKLFLGIKAKMLH